MNIAGIGFSNVTTQQTVGRALMMAQRKDRPRHIALVSFDRLRAANQDAMLFSSLWDSEFSVPEGTAMGFLTRILGERHEKVSAGDVFASASAAADNAGIKYMETLAHDTLEETVRREKPRVLLVWTRDMGQEYELTQVIRRLRVPLTISAYLPYPKTWGERLKGLFGGARYGFQTVAHTLVARKAA